MSNVDRVSGLRPVGYINGRPYTGAFNVYYKGTDATTMAIGDLVMDLGTMANDSATGMYRTVTKYTASTSNVNLVGVCVGFAPNPDGLGTNYLAASTERFVYVADDPDLVFECQEDSVSEHIDYASGGLNIEIIDAGVNTTTGASGMELDSDTKANTATLPLRLMQLVNRADNEHGDHAKWLVHMVATAQTTTTGDA